MNNPLPRRDFLLKSLAATSTLAALTPTTRAQSAPIPAAPPKSAPFVGIQMGPHSLLDEGIDRVLDLIQETAAVNATFTYSHAYNGNVAKPNLAGDHGVPVKPSAGRNLPVLWVKPHEKFYKDTPLRHQIITPQMEYATRDLFAEMLAAHRKRGIKLYARVLESKEMNRFIANYDRVVTRDINNKPTTTACWNHPEYIAFWAATVEDLFSSYDLDGLQWGAERMGPLMNVINPWDNNPPTCFCEHCIARGKKAGIDPDRARKGFSELFTYCQDRMKAFASNAPKPPDGIFLSFLRILIRYPEVLSWEYQYRLGREAICAEMYKRGKAIKPTADIGWHVNHQPSTWDIAYRAEMSYEEMAPHSDFIKIIAYHSVLGPRIRDWYLGRFQKTILGELSLEASLNLYYAMFGYDPAKQPALAELATKGFGTQYVFEETKHSVASANGKTKIYTGVGFNVPNSPPEDPEVIYQATQKSFEAGAHGIVISRDYQEMHLPNLKAVGRAITDMRGK